jgi:hypothetical protein
VGIKSLRLQKREKGSLIDRPQMGYFCTKIRNWGQTDYVMGLKPFWLSPSLSAPSLSPLAQQARRFLKR